MPDVADEDEFFEVDEDWITPSKESSADGKMGTAASCQANGAAHAADDQAEFLDADHRLDGEACALAYPAHAAAFVGDAAALFRLLWEMSDEQRAALDPQGNTVLHIAVLRQNPGLTRAILDSGFPAMTPNSRGWIALDEAVSLTNRELVELLYYHMVDSMKAKMKAKRNDLLQSLADMPDHSLSLQWEVGSPVFGFILRKYAPHDTYQVWKRGTRVRVDGSLMGVDKRSTSLIPQWKRGHFSLLFDGGMQPSSARLLDWDKKTYIDLQQEKKAAKRDKASEVRSLMVEGPGKTKVKTSDFHFKPAKTLFGNESTEKLHGWRTRVYEATGKLVAVTVSKSKVDIPAEATFEEYLNLRIPEDRSVSVPIDPFSMKGISGGKRDAESALDSEGLTPEELELQLAAEEAARKHSKKEKGGRKITARCWLAENFPLSLAQLLPILDIIGSTNKYIKRVGKFMEKYGQKELFPIKLQVPLLFTVYLVLQSKSFRLLEPDDDAMRDEFFATPADFKQKDLKKGSMLGLDDGEGFAF